MIASVESVLVEPGEVAVVTLNRPESLNALDTALLRELEAAFAGADLKERDGMDRDTWHSHHAVLRRAFQAVRESAAPTVAAVEGYAVAGGFELALACDLV